jgi:hypothetical protein
MQKSPHAFLPSSLQIWGDQKQDCPLMLFFKPHIPVSSELLLFCDDQNQSCPLKRDLEPAKCKKTSLIRQ